MLDFEFCGILFNDLNGCMNLERTAIPTGEKFCERTPISRSSGQCRARRQCRLHHGPGLLERISSVVDQLYVHQLYDTGR
jgi:hypothetical protein